MTLTHSATLFLKTGKPPSTERERNALLCELAAFTASNMPPGNGSIDQLRQLSLRAKRAREAALEQAERRVRELLARDKRQAAPQKSDFYQQDLEATPSDHLSAVLRYSCTTAAEGAAIRAELARRGAIICGARRNITITTRKSS